VRNGELQVSERGVEETKMEFIGAIAKTRVADALFIVSDIAMKCTKTCKPALDIWK